jgi:CRP-like cAMP-binding protein
MRRILLCRRIIMLVLFYPARQELIAAGEVADRIYLIARGEVEIVQGHVSGHEPLISGVEVEPDAQDADMWDNTQVSDISKSPGEHAVGCYLVLFGAIWCFGRLLEAVAVGLVATCMGRVTNRWWVVQGWQRSSLHPGGRHSADKK